MASVGNIPKIDITFGQDNIEQVITKVVQLVKPEWNMDTVKHKAAGDGLLNLVIFACDESRDQNDRLVIKTFDTGCSSIETLHHNISFLNRENLCPKIACFLNNGMAQEHTIAKPLTWMHPKLYDEEEMKKIAKELARWHQSSVLEKARAYNTKPINILWGEMINSHDKCMKSKEMEKYRSLFPEYETVVKEEKEVLEKLLDNDELEPALIHGDCNATNISTHENGAQFIDYDFTGLSYSQVDLAWYFCSFLDIGNPTVDNNPDREYEMKFIEFYIEERQKLDQNYQKSSEKLYKEVQKSKLFIYLRPCIDGPYFVHIHKTAEFVPYCAAMWRDYQNLKDEILSGGEFPHMKKS